MKNSEITAAYINLTQILNKGEKWPVKFSYALTRNMKALEPLHKDFEAERDKLLDQYNVKNKNDEPAYKTTNKIEIELEHQIAWQKEFQELLDIEVEFSPHQIVFDELPAEIEPDILYVLDFMIKE